MEAPGSEVKAHYDHHLSSIYEWIYGGYEIAKQRNFNLLKLLNCFELTSIDGSERKVLIDLGAGSGFQSIPLAEIGYEIIAIDFSQDLLNLLNERALQQHLPIHTVNDDILLFPSHTMGKEISYIICMGDTLTHLSSKEDVTLLIYRASETLTPDGSLVLSFRDYTQELFGKDRFIPVQSDDNRLFICFLEYFPDYIQVHDLLHTRVTTNIPSSKLDCSSYRKLRLDPNWVKQQLTDVGFAITQELVMNGMITIVAKKGITSP